MLSTCSRSFKLEKQDKDENTVMEDPFAEPTSRQEDEITSMTTRIICDESEWSIAEVNTKDYRVTSWCLNGFLLNRKWLYVLSNSVHYT